MARWQPNARGRLRQAALELYGEHGFDQTTVAQIAERAGLTERTFYRHFADKREIVFSGEVQRVVVAGSPTRPSATTGSRRSQPPSTPAEPCSTSAATSPGGARP